MKKTSLKAAEAVSAKPAPAKTAPAKAAPAKAAPAKAAPVKAAPVKPAPARSVPAPAAEVVKSRAEWQLRLYVAGQTARSAAALSNLRKMCETHLAGRYEIEVVDLLVNPRLAAGDQILAVPTLVRLLPEPMKKILGTLSDVERVLVGLDMQPLE